VKHSFDIWNLVSMCLMWTLWREHNHRMFEDVKRSTAGLEIAFSEHFLIGLECGVLRIVLQFWILFPLFILVYNFLVILLGCFVFTIMNII
jgi:hypothetical protein